MARTPKPKAELAVESIKHDAAQRKNIPTAVYQTMMRKEDLALKSVRCAGSKKHQQSQSVRDLRRTRR